MIWIILIVIGTLIIIGRIILTNSVPLDILTFVAIVLILIGSIWKIIERKINP